MGLESLNVKSGGKSPVDSQQADRTWVLAQIADAAAQCFLTAPPVDSCGSESTEHNIDGIDHRPKRSNRVGHPRTVARAKTQLGVVQTV